MRKRGQRSFKKKTRKVTMEECDAEPKNFESYQLGECIGKGAFGSVFQGLDTNTGSLVAIKSIALKKAKNDLAGIENEIELMSGLNNENIVKYIGSKKTKDFLYIIMEYAEGGSVKHVQKKFSNFDEHLAAKYIYQVLLGLKYLHSQTIIHRDIKAANILLSNNIAKLSDFGISVNTSDPSQQNNISMLSAYWSAPEVINVEPITEKSDIWSLGITAIEMFTGEPPYFNLLPIPAMFKIVQDQEIPLPEKISPDFKEFLQGCLTRDVVFRKSVDELINSRWIQNNINTVPIRKVFSVGLNLNDNLMNSSSYLLDEKQSLEQFMESDESDSIDFESDSISSLTPKSNTLLLKEDQVEFLNFDNDDEQNVIQKQEESLNIFVESGNESSDDILDINSESSELKIVLKKNVLKNLDNIFDDDTNYDQQAQIMKNALYDLYLILQINDSPENTQDLKVLSDKLYVLFKTNKEIKKNLVGYHGVIPLVEIIQTRNHKILENCLTFIYLLLKGNTELQISLCIIGALPYLYEYVTKSEYSEKIRLTSAQILCNLCIGKSKPLELFISTGGLSKLSEILLTNNFSKYPIISNYVIDIIDSVLTYKCNTSKLCFARIMASFDLLKYLSDIYVEIQDEHQQILDKICKIFDIFSNADTQVKLIMVNSEFIDKIYQRAKCKSNKTTSAERLSEWNLFYIMQTMRNLTMNPEAVLKLCETKAIEMLVDYLKIDKNNEKQFIMNPTLNLCFSALFNISRGLASNKIHLIIPLIPFLNYIIYTNNKLKSFAISMLLGFINFYSNINEVRIKLEQNNTLDTLFLLYRSQLQKDQILFAFSQLSLYDSEIMSEYLLQNIQEFVRVFVNTIKNETIEMKTKLGIRLVELCDNVKPFAKQLLKNEILINEIRNQLEQDTIKNATETKIIFSILLEQLIS